MRFLLALTTVAAFAALAVGVSPAVAATEFGDGCVANEASGEAVTVFEVSAPGNPLPTAAPSSGVLTAWKLNLAPGGAGIPQTLDVLRLNAATKTAQVIGESSATLTSGANVVPARIPIQAGDRLAIVGPSPVGTLVCATPETTFYGGYLGSVGSGGTSPYVEVEGEVRIPAVGVIEPDADHDGYGDETQDKCPQSAATQAPCPVVTLSASSTVKKGLAKVLVTASSQATVTVVGTVKLGKGKTVELNGGTQAVAPGTLAKFTLLFSKRLRSTLKGLPRKRSLSLTVEATAPNIVGSPTIKTLKLHLKGQAKPKKAKKGRGHKKA